MELNILIYVFLSLKIQTVTFVLPVGIKNWFQNVLFIGILCNKAFVDSSSFHVKLMSMLLNLGKEIQSMLSFHEEK